MGSGYSYSELELLTRQRLLHDCISELLDAEYQCKPTAQFLTKDYWLKHNDELAGILFEQPENSAYLLPTNQVEPLRIFARENEGVLVVASSLLVRVPSRKWYDPLQWQLVHNPVPRELKFGCAKALEESKVLAFVRTLDSFVKHKKVVETYRQFLGLH